MGHLSLRRIIIPLVLISLAVVAYVLLSDGQKENGNLQASGTVEAIEVVAAPELGGRVVEIWVQEGDRVASGEKLYRIDDELLKAQRARALAALGSAEAGKDVAGSGLELARLQYEAALDTARAQEVAARKAAWRTTQPEVYTFPVWYFERAERIRASESQVELARARLKAKQEALGSVLDSELAEELAKAESRVVVAQAAYRAAEAVVQRAELARETKELVDAARDERDLAEDELEAAQDDYDELLTTHEADEVLRARAEVAAAQANYDAALDARAALRTGEEARTVELAAAVVLQTEASLAQVEAALRQAQAEIDLIDLQLTKLEVSAPVDSVVLVRNAEPGEVVTAGAAVMILGQLDDLKVTVYIDEGRYGGIRVADLASVEADSFPGEAFEARVVRIADRAEFTPRNVQTEEGRRTTVFAVELAVVDPEGRLKPGMPVDVKFERK